ncbi:MAG: LCP family protein [Candidatus Shapirobacteria bacterium]
MTKKILLIVSAVIIALLIILSIFFVVNYKKVVVKTNKIKTDTILPTPTPDPNKDFAIALMGYGGDAHQGGNLTDSIIVAHFIPLEKKVKLISVPRDLWVPIPIAVGETKWLKINEAYAIGLNDKEYQNKELQFTGPAGGGQMSKTVLSQVVGIPVENFVALNFSGFLKTIDTLGGIDINVQKTFNDPYYPLETNINDTCGKSEDEVKTLTATMSGDKLEQQFTCRYEALHFDKGLQHMDSATALKFTRSRHSLEDSGDFNRSARQKLVIEAIKKKVISLNFIPRIIPFVNTLSGNLTTDIDINQMQRLISRAQEFQTYQIESVPLTNQNILMDSKSIYGQYILIPKEGQGQWTKVHEFINSPQSTMSATLK